MIQNDLISGQISADSGDYGIPLTYENTNAKMIMFKTIIYDKNSGYSGDLDQS
jgi:hypothetical protein